MKAEEVYNIAIHLPEMEMERLYALLEIKMKAQTKHKAKKIKPKLITEKEAREYILRTVFGRK